MGNDRNSTIPFAPGREAYEELVRERRLVLREELETLYAAKPKESVPVLEIGAGHGHFLTSYAAQHPDHWCLGIDIMTDRVRRAIKKRNRLTSNNLHFLRAEAMELMNCLPDDIRFQRIFILFPDPWPKKRHHKNRLLSSMFFDAMAERAEPGAEICFRTDHRPYFDEVHATVDSHPAWALNPGAKWPFEEVTVFQARASSFSSLITTRL